MKDLLKKIKGYKTVIMNTILFLTAMLAWFAGDSFVKINPTTLAMITAALNFAMRFVTTSPVFAEANKKDIEGFVSFEDDSSAMTSRKSAPVSFDSRYQNWLAYRS